MENDILEISGEQFVRIFPRRAVEIITEHQKKIQSLEALIAKKDEALRECWFIATGSKTGRLHDFVNRIEQALALTVDFPAPQPTDQPEPPTR